MSRVSQISHIYIHTEIYTDTHMVINTNTVIQKYSLGVIESYKSKSHTETHTIIFTGIHTQNAHIH